MVRAYSKTVTEKQLAANRANAQFAGRKPGKISREEMLARKAVAKSLQELCRGEDEANWRAAVRLRNDPKQPGSVQLGALAWLADRAHGRPAQVEKHEGGVSLTVLTGVPRVDDEPHSPPVWHKPAEPLPLFQRPAETDDKGIYPHHSQQCDIGVEAGAGQNIVGNLNDYNEATGTSQPNQCSSQSNWSDDSRSVHDVPKAKIDWGRY